MEKIEFTVPVKIGEKNVTNINVATMLFYPLITVWSAANAMQGKQEVALQRARIKYQTHFMDGDERLVPTDADIRQLPRTVASQIIKLLDKGQGLLGTVIAPGDGCTTPVVYKLGTPIELKNAAGDVTTISELEFIAETYGDVEDILASDNDLAKTGQLIKQLAKPLESPLPRLPGWALDRLTVADGIQIMRLVLPNF